MILLDTTVIIDIWRGRLGIQTCLNKHKDENLLISVISIEEIYDGLGFTAEKLGQEVFLKISKQYELIINDFDVIPLNQELLKIVGMRKGELRAKGVILDIGDCIIGVTAEEIGANRLISRNPKHYEPFNIEVESYKIKN